MGIPAKNVSGIGLSVSFAILVQFVSLPERVKQTLTLVAAACFLFFGISWLLHHFGFIEILKSYDKDRARKMYLIAALVDALLGMGALWAIRRTTPTNTTPSEDRALEETRRQFSLINRPLITITPKRYQDGKLLVLSLSGNGIRIRHQLEIKNQGNIATKVLGIAPTSGATSPNISHDGKKFTPAITPVEGFALAPNQSVRVELEMRLEWATPEEAAQNLKQFLANEKEAFTIEMTAQYSSVADDTRKYRTYCMYRAMLNDAAIIRLEYKDS